MAEELYGLSIADVMRLKRVLTLVETGNPPTLNRSPRNFIPAADILVGILTDPVAATTGLATKPKVGTLNVYSFTSTGTVDSGFDETVYNFAPQAATTDRWTFCVRDSLTGKLVISYQACS